MKVTKVFQRIISPRSLTCRQREADFKKVWSWSKMNAQAPSQQWFLSLQFSRVGREAGRLLIVSFSSGQKTDLHRVCSGQQQISPTLVFSEMQNPQSLFCFTRVFARIMDDLSHSHLSLKTNPQRGVREMQILGALGYCSGVNNRPRTITETQTYILCGRNRLKIIQHKYQLRCQSTENPVTSRQKRNVFPGI